MEGSPLPAIGVTYPRVASTTTSEGMTPPSSLLRVHAPHHHPLPAFGLYPRQRVFAECGEPPAGRWWFPALSPRIFPQMLGPIPRRFPWCIRPLLPRGHRPSPRWNRLGTPQYPYSDFRTGMILGLQSFADVHASGFARHPGRSYRSGSFHRAAVASTSEHMTVCYLPVHRIC